MYLQHDETTTQILLSSVKPCLCCELMMDLCVIIFLSFKQHQVIVLL
uniref:Uncharacterized protein n=1 Tax=Anguilla anguilla TaxID=7936 RepID=A0A0E9WKD7_ANGAN